MTDTIKAIVDTFIRSEYFSTWQSEHVHDGGWSRDTDRQDRFCRCFDAAEQGADGSTHREVIQDMREAFQEWLKYGRPRRLKFAEYPYRLEAAVLAHFDQLETWHEDNGSLDQEIG